MSAAQKVALRGRAHVLGVAINEATAEVKYFISNATGEPLNRLLGVAFRRRGRNRLGWEDCT